MQFYALLFDIYLLSRLMGDWLVLSLGSTDMGKLFNIISKQIRHYISKCSSKLFELEGEMLQCSEWVPSE